MSAYYETHEPPHCPTCNCGMTEWQPIETAPKDGTHILAARAGECIGVDEIEITEWCVMENFTWEHVEGDTYRKVRGEPTEFWNGNGHRATHWMPLPAPPNKHSAP